MRILVTLITYFGLMAACSAGTLPPVGFRTLDADGLSAVIWYPTAAAGPVTLVGDNPAFVGVPVVKDAPVQGTALPLALLSHGFSGLWRNQAWLAERLAEAGYVAVAFNHPGTSWGDMDPAWATDPGRRPHDVSRVLDAVLADGEMASRIDQTRISVIGHSLGGATALELVGGELDPALLENACGTDRSRIVCNVYRSGGMTAATAKVSARDPRISAAVLLDMEGMWFYPGEPQCAFRPGPCAGFRRRRSGFAAGVGGQGAGKSAAPGDHPLCRDRGCYPFFLHERVQTRRNRPAGGGCLCL